MKNKGNSIKIENIEDWSLVPKERIEEIDDDLPYDGIDKLFGKVCVVDTYEASDIICKVCKKHPKVFIYPKEFGACEIYCPNCNMYLDEEGNYIK